VDWVGHEERREIGVGGEGGREMVPDIAKGLRKEGETGETVLGLGGRGLH